MMLSLTEPSFRNRWRGFLTPSPERLKVVLRFLVAIQVRVDASEEQAPADVDAGHDDKDRNNVHGHHQNGTSSSAFSRSVYSTFGATVGGSFLATLVSLQT